MSSASSREGVIKFRSEHRRDAVACAGQLDVYGTLVAWRRMLRCLGLLGRDPKRYEGEAYGNLSARLPPFGLRPGTRAFLITGSRTSDLEPARPAYFAVVEGYSLQENLVQSYGEALPSSESMTHAALYDTDADVRFVFHVHSPVLWRAAETLEVPQTSPEVPYGTPAMAQEVRRLHRAGKLDRRRLFAMAGHEDGVVSYGRTAEEAGATLLGALAHAEALAAVRA